MNNPFITSTYPVPTLQNLMVAVRHHLAMHHSDLPEDIRNLMSVSLTNWVRDASAKFAAGQREHGGDIRDRNLPLELRKESMDSFWYSEAGYFWPRREQTQPIP